MSTSNDGVAKNDSKSEFGVLLRHCIAGVTSAAITKTASAPLDRIMVHMQVTECDGFRATVRHVLSKQGFWQGFWRGNGLNVLKSSPEFAVKFSVYDYAKRKLKAFRGDEHLTSRDKFVAGATAGVCSQALVYPLENAKTRLIVGNYTGISDVLAKTYRREGVRAFFRGFWPNTASIFMYTGIFLTTYEHVKQWQYDRMAAGVWLPVHHRWMAHSISAMCSSVVGTTLCYPIARIITRLQISSETPEPTDGAKTANRWKRHVSSVNIRVLYRGVSMSIAKMLPSTVITYVVYEGMCESLGVRMTS